MSGETMLEEVQRELEQYEHPLFTFVARPGASGVEIEIRFRSAAEAVHDYRFQLLPREIEQAQFPWHFQKQLYDCLHDYIIEMFTRNPQREN